MPEVISWLDALTHKLIHQRAGNVPVHSEDVVSGTFGANTGGGTYTYTGQVIFNSPTVDNVIIRGGGATLRIDDRDGSGDYWVLYHNANILRFWKDADRVLIRDTAGGRVDAGNAAMGSHPIHANWANFGHAGLFADAEDYGFMQHSGGDVIMNAGTGAVAFIRRGGVANTNEIRLDGSGMYVSDDIAIPSDRAIYFKGAWDGTHVIHHSTADDGFRYSSWNYHRFYMGGGEQVRFQVNYGIILYSVWYRVSGDTGYYFENYNTGWWCNNSVDLLTTYDHGIMRVRRDTHQSGGGSWGTCGVRSEGTAASGDKGLAFHRDGHYASSIYLGGDAIVRHNGSDGAWNRNDGNWFNPSSRKIKRDIVEFEPGGLKKVMQLKPVRFKYDPNPEDLARFEAQAAEGRWGDEKMLQHTKNFRDKEYVGFIAEELAEVFPEAVGLDMDGNPSGYKDSILAALMVQAIQELTAKVETLETTVAMQGNKTK